MLRRSVKIQLILFIVVTLLGVAYVGANYVGLGRGLFDSSKCLIKADFPDSGGIFTNAEVTYRGVTIGRVGELTVIKNGVQVDLDVDNCSDPQIPKNTVAQVADRSVVGEQYVNLIPQVAHGPFITGNDTVLPMNRNTIPIPTEKLLLNLDGFLKSVPLKQMRITISQLDSAFDGRGPALGELLDASHQLLQAASEPTNFDNTVALINNSAPVLNTQLDLKDPLQTWTHSLNLLSQQLKKSNPDIEHLFDTGPRDATTLKNFINDNRTDIGVTLANQVNVGQLLVQHIDGLEEVLELYPALAAGGQSVLDEPGHAKLGLILQTQPDPQDCGDPYKGSEGYYGTNRRSPNDLSPQAPNTSARCTVSASTGRNVRGSANVPGGDPISSDAQDYAYPRAVTKDTIGTSLQQPSALGDASWLTLLTDGLH